MEAPALKTIIDFTGKNVLVTGGDKGIGKGICRRFSEAGAVVIFTYNSNDDLAAKTAEELKKRGGEIFFYKCDIRSSISINETLSSIEKKLGNIDVLVNNAGIYPVAPLSDIGEKEWNDTLDLNLKGVHLMTRYVAGNMQKGKKGGCIVNIASIEGEDPALGHAHYAASKGGVIMYTRASAMELAKWDIRVNSVSPGLIWNENLEKEWPDGVNRYRLNAPLKSRLGEPDDIGDACLFLASDLSRWITGINLRVDGGMGATTRY